MTPNPAGAPGQWDSAYHAPVLVGEVVGLLRGGALVLDCTLGGGGHSQALLESGVERVAGIDRDPEAVAAARERLAAYASAGRFHAVQGSYADPAALAPAAEVPASPHPPPAFDGILLDLGISSHQLDASRRGFTFRPGAPLDMRMTPDGDRSAAHLLNEAGEQELASIFREYGDERRAMRLAREVVRRRSTVSFATSDHLVGAIRGALGPKTGPADFARLFQAVRIAVNDELGALARALPVLRDQLRPGGVMVVIAYHSGEDRMVKNAFREWSSECVCPPKQPMCTCRGRALGETLTRRAVTAGPEETARNPRARSARLRAWRSAR